MVGSSSDIDCSESFRKSKESKIITHVRERDNTALFSCFQTKENMMPNWCKTVYFFTGNPSELNSLYTKIKDWTSEEKHPSDFGATWLGNIAIGAGLNGEEISCRGTLDSLNVEEQDGQPVLRLETETAWVPMNELWNALLQKIGNHCCYFYFAEEPGLAVYETNDTEKAYFDADYIIDACWESHNHEEFQEYFEEGLHGWTSHDLKTILQELLKDWQSSLQTLIEELIQLQKDWNTEDAIYIHPVTRMA